MNFPPVPGPLQLRQDPLQTEADAPAHTVPRSAGELRPQRRRGKSRGFLHKKLIQVFLSFRKEKSPRSPHWQTGEYDVHAGIAIKFAKSTYGKLQSVSLAIGAFAGVRLEQESSMRTRRLNFRTIMTKKIPFTQGSRETRTALLL